MTKIGKQMMSSLSLNPDAGAASKAGASTGASASMGFLASLAGFANSNLSTDLDGDFGAALDQSAPATTDAAAAAGSAASSSTSASGLTASFAASSTTGGPSSLHDMVSALQRFVNKWHAAVTATTQTHAPQHATANSKVDTKTAASGDTKTSPAKTATTADASTTTADTATTATTDATATDATSTPSLADLLAQLQRLMQQLQQQIQNTPAIAGGVDLTGAKNLLAAGTMLGDMLKLAQAMEKSLNGALAGGAAQAGANGAASTDDLAAFDAQLKTTLGNLIDGLKSAVADQTSAPASTVAATVTAPAQIMQTTLAAAGDALRQMNVFATAASASATTSFAPVLPTATGGDTGLDLDSGSSNSGNAAAQLAGNTMLAAAETAKGANPYSFASQLSASRAMNGGATNLPGVVEQVMLQLSRNVKTGNDTMSLQLHPAELGRVDIKLTIGADGKVQGTVIASNPATLDLMTRDHKGLERALQDAGLSVDSSGLQFSLGGQDDAQRQQEAGRTAGKQAGSDGGDGTAGLQSLAVEAETYYVTPGRVNLKV